MNSAARFLLFITLFLSSVNLCAQRRDYIVNLQKDTLYGTLRFSLGMPYEIICDTQIYTVNQNLVDAYLVAETRELFKSRKLPGKKKNIFLLCIENGRINLYCTLHDSYRMENAILYAEKMEGVLIEIKNKSIWKSGDKQKEAFLELIGDNPNVVALYNQNKDFAAVDVQYYIHEYNHH